MNKPDLTLFGALALTCGAAAQDFTVTVPTAVRQQIGQLLPERSNAGAAFVSESYSTNLVFSANATARVVFVHEGAGYQNTFGYFTYTDNPDGSVTVNTAQLIVENASMPGVVQVGDGFDLRDGAGDVRTFVPGEKLGFFVIADGNRRATSVVGGWTYNYSDADGQVPDPDPAVNAGRGRGLFTSLSKLNPEMLDGQPDKARHLIMVEMPGEPGFLDGDDYVLLGFEDLRRTWQSDEDFNDLLFVLEASPMSAISGSSLFRYEPGDPDGDGVSGINDQFPNDAARATVERVPSSGMTMIAFEDRYPDPGDQDFNDACISYAFEVTSNSNGDVKDIVATFALLARGASYDAAFGLHLPGLPPNATGTIRIERFVSGSSTAEVEDVRTVQALIAMGTRRIEDVFGSTAQYLPPPSGYAFSNTLFAPGTQDAASARVHITFDVPIPASLLGLPPYDPFLYVDNPRYPEARVDIHLPGWPSFADRPSYMPLESGESTFVDSNGYPWALEVPSGWRFPMETQDIDDAYSKFNSWRTSGGALNKDWYLDAYTATGLVGPTLESLVPVRDWSIGLTQ